MSSLSSSYLARVALRGTTWVYIAFFSGKLVVFLTTILLARLLSKSDFGVVGYAVAVIGFLDVVKDLGVGAALIYHNDERVIPTAFWLNISTGLSFFLLAWFGAPFVGLFFNDSRAIWVTRVLALSFPLNAIASIQETLLIKDLAFNQKFIPDFARAISKGVLSIGLAFAGFGPWSIILGQLGGLIVSGVILWRMIPWRLTFEFSRTWAGSLLRYGLPLVSMNVISVFVLNVDYLLVGRYLGAEALGVYTLAFRVPELTILQLCNIVAQVVFPVFAKIKDDADALGKGFLKTAQYVALITVPVGLGMALLSEPFVLLLFGKKWVEVVPVMRAISIYSVLISLGYNAGDVYKAQGRPGILTRLSILQAFILVPALLWAVMMMKDIVIVGWTQVAVAFVGNAIYLLVALRMLNLQPRALFDSLKHPLLPAVGLSIAVLGVMSFGSSWGNLLQLILGTLVGAAAYVTLLWFFSKDVIAEIWNIVKMGSLKRAS
ncbi:MAG TPA: lipopolysaccharide biosynthesis protein [Anaerolineales bacterium]|nr:lipopolysaccharide biosynthesis protein [Anaerolineales bacterium]